VTDSKTPDDEVSKDEPGVHTGSHQDDSSAPAETVVDSASGDEPLLAPPVDEDEDTVSQHLVDDPIPAPEPQTEPAGQAGADEEPEAAPDVYAGIYTPNENVTETLKVLDELTDDELRALAKNGSVLLSNMEEEELIKIDAMVRQQIGRNQKHRRKLVDDGVPGDWQAVEFMRGDKPIIVFMTEAEREAMQVLEFYSRSIRHGTGQDVFTDGNKWTNLPAIGDSKIAMGLVDHSKNKDPIVVLRHKLGLSSEHSVPMWGTGLHLSLEGPGALENLMLDTKLLLEKIDQGRGSSGYVYSASSVYLNREVASFVLNKVRYSTAGTVDVETLKDLLLLTDLEPLALGAASTIFPDGYMLQRPCLTSQGGCGHVIERRVNLRRMLFVSDSKLTKDQLQFMSKRSGRVDISTIKTYQEQMRPHISRLVALKNGQAIRLRVPTIAAYERIAGAWMDKMQNKAKELVQSNANEQERNNYMARATNVALLMAYGHWVEAFVDLGNGLDDDAVDIVSRAGSKDAEVQYKADMAIDKLLEDLSGDVDLATKVVTAIEQFIVDMTIATVAVPKAICPKCGNPVSGDESSKHPHLVNINPIELFFTLLRHKIMTAGG